MSNSINRLLTAVVIVWLLGAGPLAAQTTRATAAELAQLDSRLEESSGIAWHRGAYWTHNDSGDQPRIFRLDSQGRIVHEVVITNAEHRDWEAMAQDDDYLYIADTGNNFNLRSSLQIYRVSWADLTANTARADLITVIYADRQAGSPRSHNFDAEGLAVQGARLWLFSKNRGDGQTRLYSFPKQPGSYRPAPLQTLPVDALITGADIHPETGDVVLVGTRNMRASFIWWAPTTAQGVDWSQKRNLEIRPNDQWEAVLWDRRQNQRLLLTHEKNRRDHAGLASIDLPE